jgi:hypothetical protein
VVRKAPGLPAASLAAPPLEIPASSELLCPLALVASDPRPYREEQLYMQGFSRQGARGRMLQLSALGWRLNLKRVPSDGIGIMMSDSHHSMRSTMPATTEAILKEDGAEAAFLAVRSEAHEAQLILTEVLHEDKARTWTVKELYDTVIERRPDIGHTVMGIAFGALEKAGLVYLDADLVVHVS